MTYRQKMQPILEKLRAARHNQEVQLVLQLIDVMYEEAREQLMSATPMTFAAFQAEAHALASIRKMITNPSIAEAQAKFNIKEL